LGSQAFEMRGDRRRPHARDVIACHVCTQRSDVYTTPSLSLPHKGGGNAVALTFVIGNSMRAGRFSPPVFTLC